MALFISIEGGEGAGKSALSAALVERMQKAGAEVVMTYEPGATRMGADIRAHLFRDDQSISPWTETFLFLADRAHHVAQVIRPALARGAVVISDRFADSTVAYQGYGRSLDLSLIRAMNQQATAGIIPNLTLFLDVPVAEGLRRAHPELRDRIGREAEQFHSRVLEGFKRIALAEPDRVKTIDAALPLDEVVESAWALVEARLQGAGYRVGPPSSSVSGDS